MNINQKTESVRKDMKQAEARRNGWTDFYTHNAVPFIASMQECFKQEQR